MKRAFIILSCFLILINLIPKDVDAVAPAVIRIVSGSVAEKILISNGTKMGMKYKSKSAAEDAVKRWNLDLHENWNNMNADTRANYQKYINEINSKQPVAYPKGHKWEGYGKVVLSGAAALIGLDILYGVYEQIKEYADNQQMMDLMDTVPKPEKSYKSIYGLTLVANESPLATAYSLINSDTSIAYQSHAHSKWFAEPTFIQMGEKTYYGQKYITFTGLAIWYYADPKTPSMALYTEMPLSQFQQYKKNDFAIESKVPDIPSTPSIPKPFYDYVMNPSPDKLTELEKLYPDGIEINIPLEDTVTNPNDWNDPLKEPVPSPEPAPNPIPDPGDGKDPEKLPGGDPIDEITPPEDTKPPSEDGCERPWDFKNFKTLGKSISTHFPFSIPWDVYRAFYAIFGKMEESNGEWKFVLGASTDKPAEIVIKMPSFFDGWQKFIKTVLLITFDIGLIYAIRKWLGGAS